MCKAFEENSTLFHSMRIQSQFERISELCISGQLAYWSRYPSFDFICSTLFFAVNLFKVNYKQIWFVIFCIYFSHKPIFQEPDAPYFSAYPDNTTYSPIQKIYSLKIHARVIDISNAQALSYRLDNEKFILVTSLIFERQESPIWPAQKPHRRLIEIFTPKKTMNICHNNDSAWS